MNKNMKKEIKRGLVPYVFMFLIILGVLYFVNVLNQNIHNLTYNQFMTELSSGEVKEITVTTRDSAQIYEVEGTLKKYKKDESFYVRLPKSEQVMKKIVDYSEAQEFKMTAKPDPESSALLIVLVNVLPFVVLIGLAFFFFNRQMAGNKSSLDFGKSKARLSDDKNKVTFKDVAGLKEEKEEVAELNRFLEKS